MRDWWRFVYAHFDIAGSYNSVDKNILIINEWAGGIFEAYMHLNQHGDIAWNDNLYW